MAVANDTHTLENARYLCIDTSDGASVALVDLGQAANPVLAQASSDDSRRHAEILALLIDEVVAEAGFTSLRDAHIDLVVVGRGPAPFTGLRAGLVTARVIAKVLDVPVYGVSSLDLLARQALDRVEPDREVLVATDARRKEVYVAQYKAAGADDVKCVFGPEVGSARQFVNRAAKPGLVVCGAGAVKYPAELPSDGQFPSVVDVSVMARIAAARLHGTDWSKLDHAETTAPLYLRRPDVQEPKPHK